MYAQPQGLKGIAQGNAVISGVSHDVHGDAALDAASLDADHFDAGSGSNDDLDMYWGKGLVSRKLYKEYNAARPGGKQAAVSFFNLLECSTYLRTQKVKRGSHERMSAGLGLYQWASGALGPVGARDRLRYRRS